VIDAFDDALMFAACIDMPPYGSLSANTTSIKLEVVNNIATSSKEDQATATGNMHKKYGKDWACSNRGMLVGRQTYKHLNTQIGSSQYSADPTSSEVISKPVEMSNKKLSFFNM